MDTKSNPVTSSVRNVLNKAKGLVTDAYYNAFSGFGSSRDSMGRTGYVSGSYVTQADVEAQYKDNWPFRNIVEIIPQDAMRQGIIVKTEDNAVLEDLKTRMDKLSVLQQLEKAHVLARLYGGSLILVGALDGGRPEEPLNLDKIDTIRFLNVFGRWDVQPKRVYADPLNPNFGKPETYILQPQTSGATPKRPQQEVHETRIIRLDGDYLTARQRIENMGWHASIYQTLRDPLKHFGVSCQTGANLLEDFITKVLKSPELLNLMVGDDAELSLLEKRVQLFMKSMSVVGLVVTGENEEMQKIQTPIQGFPQLMEKYERYLASAAKIPMTRFFGQQLGKLAGAVETTKEYQDHIKAVQEKKLKDPLTRLIKLFLLAKDGAGKGKEPAKWAVEFAPLVQETSEQKASNRKTQAETDAIYIDRGVITSEEVAISRFGPDGNLENLTLSEAKRKVGKEFEGGFSEKQEEEE